MHESKIVSILFGVLAVLFAGLSPAYVWAIPLAIGAAVCSGIILLNVYLDGKVNK